ncbi:ABC transporter ATP-binding protein [Blautia sp. MSJ-9]|uniref:ABC transporter ATP-binding protein n=1 Tax=Blautia sp. MSJ-9 TaxID=2841511 RepID=UPI001C0FFAB9|nr:ABC transporter ATP-binding protein [Blautia sp. MSJ-9]MBU5681124.1 ABC transporter ATP-binding protein/permease [Blautia sp. MSJ-9]
MHRFIIFICFLNLISSGSSLAITVATKGLIDGATSHDATQVKLYAVWLILTVVILRLTSVINNLLCTRTNAVLLRDMRSMFLHSLLKKQYAFVDGYHSGDLINRMFSDVSIVKDGIMNIVPQLVSMTISFFGAAVILISMDWRFVILLVAGGMIGLTMIVLFKKPMSTRHKAVQEKEGRIHAILQETLGNLRFIKAGGLEQNMEKQSETAQKEFLEVQLKKGYFSTGMSACINTVFQLSWLFCMLWGGLGIYRDVLTYGSFAAVIQLVGQIQGPIASAADVASQAYGTITSAERLKELMDLPEENTSELSGEKVSELYAHLEVIHLNNISFDYDREPVLEEVNASIHPGDFVAVTGISGGGKSTLFQLLLGIYQPKSGTVEFVLKEENSEMEGRSLPASRMTRPLFAYVPQGNILFSGTLRENLMMFNENASEEDLRSVVKAACIDHLLDQLDDGLDTLLGERGVGLSEGQAQRVAVARALLSHAPILLLDESTSALDEETEAQLLSNISQMKDKTCLIVTHRKAALSICDYELHMESGKLLRKNEKY